MRNVTLLFVGSIGLLIAGCSGAVDTESQTGSVITADGGASDTYEAPCPPASCLIDGACVEGFTAGGFVYVAAATMRGIGDGIASVGAIFVGTFTCAAIHALGGCDHGH